MKNQTSSPPVHIDPVCMMEVRGGKQDVTYLHKRQVYYFCAESCRKAFESNPGKYLTPEPVPKKGWWGRYLDRLNKTTGGKAMKCH